MFGHRLLLNATTGLLAVVLLVAATPAEESRDATTRASRGIMERLYAAQPALKPLMRESAGYVTAANVTAAQGTAMVVLWRTRQEAYMRFDNPAAASSAPLDLVLVFPERPVLGEFLFKGRTLPAGAGAERSPDDQTSPYPGAVWVAPDVWGYVLEGDRLVDKPSLPSIRFYKDDALN